jgi:MoaA/NifB/PqqE/SkfB family radical SAM enzyme
MFPSNLPILGEMLSDRRYRAFVVELDEMFRGDPTYSARKQKRILESAARGEKILRFEDRYVVSSFFPPMPSRAFKTFVTGGIDNDNLYRDLAYARRSAPLTVHLCITTRCPYRCEHCGATYHGQRCELTRDEWIRVIRDLQDLGVAYIVFSGGEPLVRDDMEEIVRAVDDRSTTLLFTNGRQLTLERARSLKQSGLFILAVSLDSPDPEQHNRMRRNPKAFSYALSAIRNASRAGLYTLVSAVVYRRHLNKQNLFRLFRLGKENGAHEVRIHEPLPRGELTDPGEAAQIFYTKEDVARLYRIQFAANQSASGLPKVSSFPYTEGPCKFGCGAGVLHSYISATGDLWPCDFVPLSFGNVLKEGLREVYGRMLAAGLTPNTFCMAKAIAGKLKGKQLPLSPDESAELCRAYRSQSYPRFFKDLQAA